MPLSCAEGLGTAQIAFVITRPEPACEVGCNKDVGCETDLRAVRDGFIGWALGMARLAMAFLMYGIASGTRLKN